MANLRMTYSPIVSMSDGLADTEEDIHVILTEASDDDAVEMQEIPVAEVSQALSSDMVHGLPQEPGAVIARSWDDGQGDRMSGQASPLPRERTLLIGAAVIGVGLAALVFVSPILPVILMIVIGAIAIAAEIFQDRERASS